MEWSMNGLSPTWPGPQYDQGLAGAVRQKCFEIGKQHNIFLMNHDDPNESTIIINAPYRLRENGGTNFNHTSWQC